MDRKTFEQHLDTNPFEQLSKIVYKMLKNDILSFKLEPGTKINTTQIATDLEISRTPVKEAVKFLHEDGLLETYPEKNGYYVYTMSRSSMEDLYFARSIIESNATYHCALKKNNIDLKLLRELAEEFQDMFAEQDFSRIDELDPVFHRIIVESTKNQYLIKMYESIETMIAYHNGRTRRVLQMTSIGQFAQTVATQHIMICNAIEFGVPEIARDAARSHVESTIDFIRRNMEAY